MIPVAGSAYTYSYATMGEFVAWIIGWDLVLEYAVGAATVSISWSRYLVKFLAGFDIHLPAAITTGPWDGGFINLPAVFVVILMSLLLVKGTKESATINAIIVALKVTVVFIFIFLGWKYINTANYENYIPENTGNFGEFGFSGIIRAAAIVFFAYIGFDAVSTAAQEAKNPQRDMPIAIIGSLLICTFLYIIVSGIATGVVPYGQLDVPDPIAVVADHAGLDWMGRLIKFGAVAGLSSVILVMLLGQSRVFYSMARDGLLPPFVSRVHPRFRTPWLTSIATGIGVAFFSAVFTVREAGSLCSIGTLLAFVIVSIGVLVLRVREPGLERRFSTPWIWFVAPAGALSALALMLALPWPTWRRLIVWFVIGIVVYFSYGVRHSRLAQSTSTRKVSPDR